MRLLTFTYQRKTHSFTDYGELLAFLEKIGLLENVEFSWDDQYVAITDIGYPFPYWNEGETGTVREWVAKAKKYKGLVDGKNDEDIAHSIVSKSELWKLVE